MKEFSVRIIQLLILSKTIFVLIFLFPISGLSNDHTDRMGKDTANDSDQIEHEKLVFETRSCHFKNEKNMEDLIRVTNKWKNYLNKSGVNYSAWLLTPQFYNTEVLDHEVYWFGASPSRSEFMKSLDVWASREDSSWNKVRAEFDSILTCESRLAWQAEKTRSGSPENLDQGRTFILMCDIRDGYDLDSVSDSYDEMTVISKRLGVDQDHFRLYGSPFTQSFKNTYFYSPDDFSQFDYLHMIMESSNAAGVENSRRFGEEGRKARQEKIISKVNCEVLGNLTHYKIR